MEKTRYIHEEKETLQLVNGLHNEARNEWMNK